MLGSTIIKLVSLVNLMLLMVLELHLLAQAEFTHVAANEVTPFCPPEGVAHGRKWMQILLDLAECKHWGMCCFRD